MAVDISDKTIVKYQTERLKERAAAKTINDEVVFLLRILPTAQAGAIRHQLRGQKQLKLHSSKRVGKAFTQEQKEDLIRSAKEAPRSKAVYMAMMFALHAGLRNKEIRMLTWPQVDLIKRIVTVGESKTDAGTGRTIPLNDDLFASVVQYAKWYTGKFGTAQSNWYLFPAGRPVPNDPTRPQTSLKTAWRNVRTRANIEGRLHDARHTFVTDLAESGVGDEVIRDLAGHVSKQMITHYSHIRTQAKRSAVEKLTKRAETTTQTGDADSGLVPQDLPQVRVVNVEKPQEGKQEVDDSVGSPSRTRTYDPMVNGVVKSVRFSCLMHK